MNHTLGPWHMHSVDGCGYYVLGPGPAPQFICTLDEGNYDCQAANAALIAAAPEMLAVLKQAEAFMADDFAQVLKNPVNTIDLYRNTYSQEKRLCHQQVLAAIRTAEGKGE